MTKINIILDKLKKLSVFFILFSSFISNAASVNELKIAAGVMGGTYYPVALQICSIVMKYSPITRCDVIATSGSINNLNLLTTNKADFAFVQSDVARDAAKGIGVYVNQKPKENLRVVLNMFPEIFSMMVKDESGIVNFSDLSGKTLGVNLKGAGAKSGLMSLFKYFKFESDPKILHVPDSQMYSKLCDNQVDAVVLFTGHPSGIVTQIASTCDVEFVSIDPLKLDNMLIENPIYEKSIIPAKSYVGISRNALSFATRALLVTNSDIEADKVQLVTRILKRYFDEFKASYPVLGGMDKDLLFKGEVVPAYDE